MVYTRWRNLKKTKAMEVGQVGFNDPAKVRKCKAEKNNAVVNALNRTKEVSGLGVGWSGPRHPHPQPPTNRLVWWVAPSQTSIHP